MKRGAILLLMSLLVVIGCDGEPAILRQNRKMALIETIRHTLLESVEGEKSAVLATSDAESEAFADEARRAAAEIKRLAGELHVLVAADALPAEVEKLKTFDEAWAESEAVDKRLLALAVVNSNLKATRLVSEAGAHALDGFVDLLATLQRDTVEAESLRCLSQAAVAALRIQSLLSIHIPSADDAEMTRLQQRMGQLSGEVEGCIERERVRLQFDGAAAAWGEYRRLSAEVVRLSRQNTNVISFDVSVHEKRRATKECLSALAALLTAVGSAPSATR